MTKPVVLLKLSGEVLCGLDRKDPFPYQKEPIKHICEEIASVHNICNVAALLGGGNIFRGSALVQRIGLDSVVADYMGMLATMQNAIALQDVLEREYALKTRVLSALEAKRVAEDWIRRRAISHLAKGRVCIFAGGTGNPRNSTDAAMVLRAKEISADLVLKGTKVNGIYDKDPLKNADARFIPRISHADYVACRENLKIVDSAAVEQAAHDGINIRIFNIFERGNLAKIASGENIGSLIAS